MPDSWWYVDVSWKLLEHRVNIHILLSSLGVRHHLLLTVAQWIGTEEALLLGNLEIGVHLLVAVRHWYEQTLLLGSLGVKQHLLVAVGHASRKHTRWFLV